MKSMPNRLLSLITVLLIAAFAPIIAAKMDGVATRQTSAPASANEMVAVQENVVYATVSGSDLHLDVYEPAGRHAASSPAVVLIHGGGWTDLDKSTMRAMGQLLSRSGFVAFSLDYRLFKEGENRWPAQLDDVQRAVRWIRGNATKYSVDPQRIGAFGHSAGAQLAALLGLEDTRDNSDPALAKYSSKVQAVVDVSGPADFTSERDSESAKFLTSFLGADYAKDPEIWQAASPVFRVSKNAPPFLIVHGTQDQNVPISQAQELYEKLQAAGSPVFFVKVEDGHTFQTPDARRELAIETIGFFNRYLAVAR
jgi:acetyl esterase/lipase